MRDSNRKASFNDLQVQKAVKEQRDKEYREKKLREQQQKQEERQQDIDDFKNTTLHFYQMDKKLLITMIYSLFFALISLYQLSITTSISCLICMIFTLLVGKSSFQKNGDRKLTNTILYNMSQGIFDFIDFKIPFEIFPNKNKWLSTYTFLGIIIYSICPSSNILYGLVTVMIIISYIVSFSMKDVESINKYATIITTPLLIGLFVKAILNYLFIGILSFDAMNVLLLNLFTIVKIYTYHVTIYHK